MRFGETNTLYRESHVRLMKDRRTLQIQRLRLLDVARRSLKPAEQLEPSLKLYTYCGRLSSWSGQVCVALLQEPDIVNALHSASLIIVVIIPSASACRV